MTCYLDSSALVKLYVPEEGHAKLSDLEPPLVVSALARVEVPAAFWRKHRVGELDASDAALLTRAFEDDQQGTDDADARFSTVPVSPAVLDEAARLVALHPLRAFDAVQLASALLVERALVAPLLMATFDHALGAAAAAEGLGVLPRTT